MKILKTSKLPPPIPPKIFRGKCYHCGCEVEAPEDEVKYYPMDKDAENEPWPIVKCPTNGCGRDIIMELITVRNPVTVPDFMIKNIVGMLGDTKR